MKLDVDQVVELISLSMSSKQDEIGCEDCYALMDQFTEAEMSGGGVPAALEAIRTHLEQCRCCRYEYEALLLALREIR